MRSDDMEEERLQDKIQRSCLPARSGPFATAIGRAEEGGRGGRRGGKGLAGQTGEPFLPYWQDQARGHYRSGTDKPGRETTDRRER